MSGRKKNDKFTHIQETTSGCGRNWNCGNAVIKNLRKTLVCQ